MKTNSRVLSLCIAVLVTLITVILLRWILVIEAPWIKVVSLTFISTFIISLLLLELLLFTEIRKITSLLNRSTSQSPESVPPLPGHKMEDFKQALKSYAELKQLEIDQLKSMAAYRREFLADISHELKTPIFAAQGFVHTLLDGAINDDNVKMRFLKKAAKSLDGLDALVQDLLILSRLETGQITMDIQNFNMFELTLEVFEQLENKATKKDIKLGLGSGAYKNIMVRGDRHRISQVVRNLVLNGIYYTDENGRVTVDFEVKSDIVVVHVRDNGRGIPTEHLDRIFQRFYRVEKSRGRSHNRGGTGLGLAIVKHILEQHQSQIKVKSNINKGSDFYFELPKGKAIN